MKEAKAMKICSVNAARVQNINVDGRVFSTGMFKTPVQGAVAVGELGLATDAQADLVNHGGLSKAVYAFSNDQYAFWAAELGRDDLAPGFFGENLTVVGLDETCIAVGDRFHAGGATLEVSQPRVPCSKLGLRAGDLGFVRQFLKQARPGTYLRVITQGDVQTGDHLEPVQASATRDDPDLAIACIYSAVFDKSMPAERRLEILGKNLELGTNSDEWSDQLRAARQVLSRD